MAEPSNVVNSKIIILLFGFVQMCSELVEGSEADE